MPYSYSQIVCYITYCLVLKVLIICYIIYNTLLSGRLGKAFPSQIPPKHIGSLILDNLSYDLASVLTHISYVTPWSVSCYQTLLNLYFSLASWHPQQIQSGMLGYYWLGSNICYKLLSTSHWYDKEDFGSNFSQSNSWTVCLLKCIGSLKLGNLTTCTTRPQFWRTGLWCLNLFTPLDHHIHIGHNLDGKVKKLQDL